MYKHMHGAELITRYLLHRDVGGSGIILHPRMGGHRIVTRNGPAELLTTKMVEDGPARRVFDDELKQLHRRIGKATGGIDERR